MEIKRQSANCKSPAEVYTVSKSPFIEKMSSLSSDEPLFVSYWLLYDDINAKGDAQTILGIYDEHRQMSYATNSPTFIKAFVDDIVTIFGEDGYYIKKYEGFSKNGREFISCAYDEVANKE